ncbi:hypothetical protein J3R30DRAFT_3656500 [Lentinula aciculospora]|uniref:Uncharacterized protein n=1 Tax=Lentinula aciculospora TaxID=153920 RepID=A0A9W9AGY1_9AGAR|nr:hypothetical protein J3R30DRAFT_3656500 [Lentinula aciculospora]
MVAKTSVDEYPSLLWIVIPPVIILSAYFTRKWYLARKLRLYGIGKGAPGFQTNVRRIRVTPEIAARIRRGEEVSPEEITAASAMAEGEGDVKSGIGSSSITETRATTHTEPVNEWLPQSIIASKKRAKGKRK